MSSDSEQRVTTGWIHRLLDWPIRDSTESGSTRELLRDRLVVATALLLMPIGLAFSIQGRTVAGHWTANAITVFVGAAVLGFVPWLQRWLGGPAVAKLVTSVVALVYLSLVVGDGGLSGPAMVWAPAMPLLAALLVGPEAALAAGALTGAAVVLFYAFDQLGVVFPVITRGAAASEFRLTGLVALVTFATIFAWFHVRLSEMALGLLEATADDLRRANRELAEARDVTEAAGRAKDEFLATMSHEIRTPLNAVVGMTSLLLDSEMTGAQREYADTIRSSTDTLLCIINDILDYSKIEAGQLELEESVFCVRDAAEGVLELAAAAAQSRGLELVFDPGPEVPEWLVGDPGRLRQILLNLVTNAVKFTNEGEVTVTVGSRPVVDGQTQLEFSIKDTGIGVPAEAAARLMQPFTQVDASTTRRYGGTGLGLAISRRLAERMGGRLWFHSLPGVGSDFRFTILARPAPPTSIDAAQGFAAAKLVAARVLLVEPNAAQRRSLVHLLEGWGLEVVVAQDVAASQRALVGPSIDVAVVDLDYVDASAHGLSGRNPPLVTLRSAGRRGDVREAWTVVKPVKAARLRSALLGALEGTSAEGDRAGEEHIERIADRHPLRILVAEDNLVNQRVAARLLERLGYRADIVANGLEALRALEMAPYDVVFLDIRMPEMDGVTAAAEIAARTTFGRPWLIALTADALAEARSRYLEAGFDDYLAKPFHLRDLAQVLLAVRAKVTEPIPS